MTYVDVLEDERRRRAGSIVSRASLSEIAIGIRNILLGSGVASIALWRSPKKWAIFATETLATLDSLREQKGLPLLNVQRLLGDSGPIEISLCNPWMGAYASRTADIASLCMLARLTNPRVVFEIGTLHGHTALHLALNVADDAVVYTLDLPTERTAANTTLPTTVSDRAHIDRRTEGRGYLFADSSVEHKITCLIGDSASFDFSPYNEIVDLFFIDGAHSYEYVRSDTLNALRCCHPGSVVAWHDFGRRGVNGVSRCLLELAHAIPIYAIPGGSLAFAELDAPAEIARAWSRNDQ